MITLKEKILRREMPNYYEENYASVSFENEAYLEGTLTAIEYCNMHGLQLSDEVNKSFNDDINMRVMMYQDELRKVDNELVEVDNLFSRVIEEKPMYLDEYPKLNCEYKKENDKVVPKSIEEVKYDFNNFNYEGLNENQVSATNVYYANLIDKKEKANINNLNISNNLNVAEDINTVKL